MGVGCHALLQGIFLTQGSTIHSKVCLYSSDKLFEMLAPQAMTKKKAMTKPRQHIKKQRHYFTNKGSSIQSYGFSSGHVWMRVGLYESWTIKKAEY